MSNVISPDMHVFLQKLKGGIQVFESNEKNIYTVLIELISDLLYQELINEMEVKEK